VAEVCSVPWGNSEGTIDAPRPVRDTSHVSTLLRRASLPILALAIASCWLTASLGEPTDGGAGDASGDIQRPDGGRDGEVDARHDGSSPRRDAAAEADAAMDGATLPDASCSGATYEESVRSAAPLAYWRLNEDGGATAVDRTGHGYSATYSEGGVTYGQPGIAGDKSVLLDGVSGEILVAGKFETISEFQGSAPYSLEAWIQPKAITVDYQGILSNELQTDAGKEGYVMYLQEDAGIGFDRYAEAGISTPLTEAGVVSANGHWYHVVGVYDGTTMTLYVDGSMVTSKSSSLRNVNAGPCMFAIGATHCGSTGWFQGYVDEVAVYAYALDAGCVKTHYDLGSGK
jgi:hypothetical protein